MRKGAVRSRVDDLEIIPGFLRAKSYSCTRQIPADYKPIEQVMINQAGLVEIMATLKQVLGVKG